MLNHMLFDPIFSYFDWLIFNQGGHVKESRFLFSFPHSLSSQISQVHVNCHLQCFTTLSFTVFHYLTSVYAVQTESSPLLAAQPMFLHAGRNRCSFIIF